MMDSFGNLTPLELNRRVANTMEISAYGVGIVAVADRARLISSRAKRALLFFLQALSVQTGGMRSVAARLFEMFPERIGTPAMHKAGLKIGQNYCRDAAVKIAAEHGQYFSNDPLEIEGGWAIKGDPPREVIHWVQRCRERLDELARLLTALCVDPRLEFDLPGEVQECAGQEDRELFLGRHPEAADYMRRAECSFFRDVIGALLEMKKRQVNAVRDGFAVTAITREVWDGLDAALETGKMVMIEGESRLGKSTAAEGGCQMPSGEARFGSLQGISNRTNFFRAMASGLGVSIPATQNPQAIQARIEHVLQGCRLMIVLDEAHHLLTQSAVNRTRPVLLDWVDTALCNYRVPVALLATPQWTHCMAAIEGESGWNGDQFRGRLFRHVCLPKVPTEADLRIVAKKLIPAGDSKMIDLAVGRALTSRLYLPALVDLLDESRLLAHKQGRQAFTLQDMKQALSQYCVPSDQAKQRVVDIAQKASRRRGSRLLCPPEDDFPPVRTIVASPMQAGSEPPATPFFTDRKPQAPPANLPGRTPPIESPVLTG
jgi:hypothetical protein